MIRQTSGSPSGVRRCAAVWHHAAVWLAAAVLAGTASAQTPPRTVITSGIDFWAVPDAEKTQAQPVRLEMVVNYYDPFWNLLWGRNETGNFYLPVQPGMPLPLKHGQRVRLEGTVVPAKGFSGRGLGVTVLEDHVSVEPRPVRGELTQSQELDAAWVAIEGAVIRQIDTDPTHEEYLLLVDGRSISVRVLLGANEPIPQLENQRVRCNGVFVGARNAAGELSRADVWVPRRDEITVLGPLESDPRFGRPRTPIGEIGAHAGGTEYVRVTGVVRPGGSDQTVVLRDDSGQLTFQTAQPLKLSPGRSIDVVGRVEGRDLEWTLRDPLFRPTLESPGPAGTAAATGPIDKLRLAAQVVELEPDAAARGYPVKLTGVVAWSDPRARHFFLVDSSGGVRVNLEGEAGSPPALGATLNLTGATTSGTVTPEVILGEAVERGGMAVPTPRNVTYEQAMTGAEESHWVRMRGYLRSVDRKGPWTRLDLTTAAGEFTALAPPEIEVANLTGSLLRISGICTAQANARRELTGITLWVADRDAIEVEEPAPADPFAIPASNLAVLRQNPVWPEITPRVRVSGTVLAQVPGQYFSLQEEEAGVLVLTRDAPAIRPGTALEVVGFPGREGSHLVLREAVWRAAPTSLPAPVPLNLPDPARLRPEADGRLVRLEATVLDTITLPDATRLTLRAQGVFFEGRLETAALRSPPAAGSEVQVTGVYRLETDEFHRPHSFTVLLRDARDLKVVAAPPWWTPARATGILAALGLLVVVVAGWVTVLRRRVRQQTEQIRRQLEKEARMQAEIERASRLDSLGILAGGIAHDFNNLLTAIMGNLGLMRLEEDVMHKAGDLVENAERASKRASEITQQLLTFSRGGDPVRAAVDLAEVVREAARFAGHGSNVRVEFTIAPGLPPAKIDAGQISRVVHNLTLNAIQAMPDGGLLRVAVGAVRVGADELPGLAAGQYLRVTFADNGPGIPAERLPRIFDPYFSTKVKGSGLGLATAHSIVRKHQGHIAADSVPGHGATFQIWLPVAEQAATAKTAESSPAQPAGKARVLFMDDEEAVCRVAGAILRRVGHSATVVHDGAAAVSAFHAARAAGHPFDLVILDLTVPGGMGGRETVAELRQVDQDVPVIASSGYSHDPVMSSHREFGFTAVLPKPYDPVALARLVDQVCAAHR